MLISAVFYIVIPQMREYSEKLIVQDNVISPADCAAISANIERASPTISTNNAVIYTSENFDIREYINSGNIRAINADGDDISDRIVVSPYHSDTKEFYDADTGLFRSNLAGEYKFILSVKDATTSEYFGKEQRDAFVITVKEAEAEQATESLPET